MTNNPPSPSSGAGAQNSPIAEKVRVSGLSLRDLLKPEVLSKAEAEKLKMFPVFMVFQVEEPEMRMLTINHENRKEVEEGIIHVQSDSPEILHAFAELQKKLRG